MNKTLSSLEGSGLSCFGLLVVSSPDHDLDLCHGTYVPSRLGRTDQSQPGINLFATLNKSYFRCGLALEPFLTFMV